MRKKARERPATVRDKGGGTRESARESVREREEEREREREREGGREVGCAATEERLRERKQ